MSFEELFRLADADLRGVVARSLASRGGSGLEVDDVVQDVWLRIWSSWTRRVNVSWGVGLVVWLGKKEVSNALRYKRVGFRGVGQLGGSSGIDRDRHGLSGGVREMVGVRGGLSPLDRAIVSEELALHEGSSYRLCAVRLGRSWRAGCFLSDVCGHEEWTRERSLRMARERIRVKRAERRSSEAS